MLHFQMNMPFHLMALYGSIMIVAVLLLRILLKRRLPEFVFPILWGMVLLRLLVPFSLSSPLSLRVPEISLPYNYQETARLEATNLTHEGAYSNGAARSEEKTDSYGAARSGEKMDSYGAAQGGEAVTLINSESAMSQDAQNSSLFPITWQKALPILYVLGLLIVAVILCSQKYCCSKKLRDSLLIEHNETVNTMLRGMNMGHILVFTNDAIASPLVYGLLNPRIYLPARMDFQNTVLLRHILSHETMHIRHRDNWVKTVMLAALCINWYNPLVWIMSKCLSSDLETSCDAAVLKPYDVEERKNYAYSLLAMAITGNRAALLYSAFSKTEVERRIQNILHYKKASCFVLLFSVLFLAGSTVVFATGGQAPFSPYLTAYCASAQSRWGVKAEITRDIALGENSQRRAQDVIFSVLEADDTNDPEILEPAIKAALAEEFGVEMSAFSLTLSLCLSREDAASEYAGWGITRSGQGFYLYLYKGETVRTFADEMLGSYQSRHEGTVDISVQRNSLGEIVSVTALHQGDAEFDRRTQRLEQDRNIYDTADVMGQFELHTYDLDTAVSEFRDEMGHSTK